MEEKVKEKNKKKVINFINILERSPMGRYGSPSEKQPVHKAVAQDLNLKDTGRDLGSKGLDIAKGKKGGKEREASPGTIILQEDDNSNIFKRNAEKKRSTKVGSKEEINMRLMDKSGQGGRSPVPAKKGLSSSPNNPDDDIDPEEPIHNQKLYLQGKDQEIVTRPTKVLSLINSESSPRAFLDAKPTNPKRLSNLIMGREKSKEKSTPERVNLDPNKVKSGMSPSKRPKFGRLAMAMMVSKGASCEDRIITRAMRGDESGGVVDLGGKTIKGKKVKGPEIKKFGRAGGPEAKKEKKKVVHNPSQRLKAAKIVQAWWRTLLNDFEGFDKKIIKIQAVWRGTWYRLHLYDILYYTYLIKAFVDRIMVPIKKKVGREGLEALLPWAQKYWVRRHLNTLVKVQACVRGWMAAMRHKKKRSINLIDKFYLQRLLHGMRKIKNFAEGAENAQKKRQKNLQLFAKKLLQKMKVRIFHNWFWKLYKNIYEGLQLVLWKITMKKYSRTFNVHDMRANFTKWMKAVNIRNNKATPFLCRILKKCIYKPRWDDFLWRLRRKPPKGFKEKFLMRLLRQNDKYRDVVLQNFLHLWKQIVTRMAGDEFKNSLTSNLLFRTKKKLEFNNMHLCFRDWRTKVANISDIKKFAKGVPKLKRGILRKCWDKAMPKLIPCVNGIKARTTKALCMGFPKFQKITLRRYLRKWVNVHHRIGQLQISGMFLSSFKRGQNSKILYKMMFGTFQDWRRKAHILSFLEEKTYNDQNRNRLFGAKMMVDGLKKYGKRKAFAIAYPKLKRHLMDIIKNRSVKALFKSNLKLNKTCLRVYWNKLRSQKLEADRKDLKNNFFRGITKKFSRGLEKKNMRLYLKRWKKQVPDPKEVHYRAYKGFGLVLKHARRLHFRSLILPAMKRRLDLDLIEASMKQALGLSKKFFKKNRQDFFYLWKQKAKKLTAMLTSQRMAANFMKSHLKSFCFKLLDKAFKHWKKKPGARMTLHGIFMRNKKMCNATWNYINFCIKNMKKEVFKKLAKKNGNNAIMKAYMKFIDFFVNGRKQKKHFWIRHWHYRARELELKDVRQAIMKMAFKQNGIKSRSLYIGHFFFRWRNIVRVDGKFDDQREVLRICQGFDKLDRFVRWKKYDFFLRLKRLMNLDTRGKVLLTVWKRANRSKNSVLHCMEKWRRKASKLEMLATEKTLKNKLCGAYMKKVGTRVDRDLLSKSFRYWKNKPEFSAEFLINVTDGFNMINRGIKKKKLGEPFILINRKKNYKKLFKSLVPAGSKLAKKFEQRQLRQKWDHWVMVVDNINTQGLKFSIFEKTNSKMLLKLKMMALSNRFRFWDRMCKRRKYNYESLVRGVRMLHRHILRPKIQPLIKKCYDYAWAKDKKKAVNSLLQSNRGFEMAVLRYKLKKWYRRMLAFDDKAKPVAVRTFKRFVLEKYYWGPIERYWNKWLKLMVKKKISGVEMHDAIDKVVYYYLKPILINTDFFDKLRRYRSGPYMNKQLMKSLLPSCKRLNRRMLRDRLTRWRKTAQKMAAKMMEARLFNKVFSKNHKALQKRWLLVLFRWWSTETKPKKEMDYRKVLWLNNTIYRVLCFKYMTKFIDPLLKEYSLNKFLRNCLMKNSKFHKKLLVPFLAKWRKINYKLAAKEMTQSFQGKVITKTFSFYNNKTIKKIMKNRIRLWRKQKNALAEIERQITPEFVGCLTKYNYMLNFPYFLKQMENNKVESLKKEISFGLLNRSGKCQKRILRNYFRKWQDKIKEMEIQAFKKSVVKSYLRTTNSKYNKMALKRAFERMKVRRRFVAAKNTAPYVVGTNILKKALKRQDWAKFKKITRSMNLRIPEGMSFNEALLRMGPDVAKILVFRNITFRPYWKHWRNNIAKMKTKDAEADMFKKLFLKGGKNKGKIILRQYIKRWSDTTQKMVTMEMKKGLKAGLMKNMYANNNRICLKHYMRKWDEALRAYYKKLERISHGVKILYMRMWGPYWRQIYTKVFFKNAFDKTPVAKKIIMNVINNTQKGMILLAFHNWKKKVNSFNDLDLKRRILQVFLKNQNQKGVYRNKFKIHDKFMLWKVRSTLSEFDKFGMYRRGVVKATEGMRKMIWDDVFPAVKKMAVRRSLVKRLNRLVQKWDVDFKDKARKRYFKLWRITIVKWDKQLKEDLERIVTDYEENCMDDKKYGKPIRNLCEFMKRWTYKKERCADNIANFVKEGLDKMFYENEDRKKKDLKYFLTKLYEKEQRKIKLNFRMWQNQIRKSEVIDGIRTIQAYLRKKLESVHTGRDLYAEAVIHLRNHINKNTFVQLHHHSLRMRLRQLLLRNIKDIPDNLKEEFLRKALLRWYEELRRFKMAKGITIINSGVKRFFAMKLKKMRLNRKLKTNNIVLRLLKKYMDKLKIYFYQWSLNVKSMKLKHNANNIQKFLHYKLNRIKNKKLFSEMKHRFLVYIWMKVCEVISEASRIKSDAGLILHRTLTTIFIERPFQHLKKMAVVMGNIKAIGNVYPKIIKAFRFHYLPFYFKRWKRNAEYLYEKKLIRLQNFLRGKMALIRERLRERKEYLTFKYMKKCAKENTLLMKIYLKQWALKTKILGLLWGATKIQSIWRGNNARKKINRDIIRIKAKEVFRRMVLKNLNRNMTRAYDATAPLKRNLLAMTGTFEKKYIIDDVMDYSNAKIRNILLFMMTKNQSHLMRNRNLKFYWEKFRRHIDHIHYYLIKVQRTYRKHAAQRNALCKRRLKDILLQHMKKYERFDKGKRRICFLQWMNKTEENIMINKAKFIQLYLRKRMLIRKRYKIVMMMRKEYKWYIPFRVISTVKVFKLKQALTKLQFPTFKQKMKGYINRKKLLNFFSKRFADMDESLMYLYLKRVFQDYWKQVRRLNIAREKAATKIQTNFKRFMAIKRLNNFLKKLKLFGRIRKRYVNQIDQKYALYMRHWIRYSILARYIDATKTVQLYMRQTCRKAKRYNWEQYLIRVEKGMKHMQLYKDTMMAIRAFIRIRDKKRANRFEQMCIDLYDKVMERKQWALRRMKDLIKSMNEASYMIQKCWHQYKFSRMIWNSVLKLRKMKFICKLMMNKDLRFLNTAVRAWQKKAVALRLVVSAQALQLFLRQSIIKYQRTKKKLAKARLRVMVNNALIKSLLYVAKSYDNFLRFEKAYPLVFKHIWKKFKYRLNNFDRLKTCSVLYDLRCRCIKKIMKYFFFIYASKVHRLKRNRGASLIQKNFRIFRNRKISGKMFEKIQELYRNYDLKTKDKKKYYFLHLWRIAFYLKTKEAVDKVSHFTKRYLLVRKFIKMWRQMSWKYCIHTGMINCRILKIQIKRLTHLNRVYKLCFNKMIKNFHLMMMNIKLGRTFGIIVSILNNFKNRKDLLFKAQATKRWRQKMWDYRYRERALHKAMDVVNRKMHIICADRLNDFFTYKRFINFCEMVKAKWFLKKIKRYSTYRLSIVRLADALAKHGDELYNSSYLCFGDRLKKAYASKIISGLMQRFEKIFLDKFIPKYKKIFMFKLAGILYKHSKMSYDGQHQEQNTQPGPRKLQYQAQATSDRDTPKEKGQDSDPTFMSAPIMMGYFAELFRRRKMWAYIKIKKHSQVVLFLRSVKKNCYSLMPLKAFMHTIKKRDAFNKETPLKIKMLRKLLKTYAFRKLFECAPEIVRRVNFMYFIRVVVMSGDIMEWRKKKGTFRKWAVKCNQSSIKKNKMLALYKNMQLQFLQMSTQVFGDNDQNAGIFDQMNQMSEKFNMYTGDVNNDVYKNVKSKHVKKVQYTYNFEDNKNAEEENFDKEANDNVEIPEEEKPKKDAKSKYF